MKGTTELSVTHATMVEAMQEYLDKRITATRQRVTKVSAESTRSGYGSDEFKVTIEEVQDQPMEAKT